MVEISRLGARCIAGGAPDFGPNKSPPFALATFVLYYTRNWAFTITGEIGYSVRCFAIKTFVFEFPYVRIFLRALLRWINPMAVSYLSVFATGLFRDCDVLRS